MEKERSRLKIHTNVRREAQEQIEKAKKAAKAEKAVWASLPHPKAGIKKKKAMGAALTVGERLIRNTAIAGALLLCVLAVRNVDQPWSTQAISGLKQAMTMRVDWDESIGRLSFVRALVPETALVFLNMDEKEKLLVPVNGEKSHVFSEQEPWVTFSCKPSADVLAAADGRVLAAAQAMSGDWVVLIGHEGGAETVYGYLADASVQVGQTVTAGDRIGHAAAKDGTEVYFELHRDGKSIDPAGYFA